MRQRPKRSGALLLAAVLFAQLAVAIAGPRSAAAASIGEFVSVSEVSAISPATNAAADAVARQVNGRDAQGRSAMVGMTQVLRGGVAIQTAPGGYQFPMGVTAMSIDAMNAIIGPDVAAVVQQGQVVLGATSAGIRGAQVGDVVELIRADGAHVQFTIGMIAPNSVIGGAELVLSDAEADALQLGVVTRMIIWGFSGRAGLEKALSDNGLISTKIRVGRSWDIPSPDSTLSLSETKAKLGEFPYYITASGGVVMWAPWVAANISGGGVRTAFADIGIVAACHNAVRGAIQSALSEIRASGLAGAIDTANTNSFGGCFGPRFSRVGGNIGSLSRHSWGMAIDMNTTTNVEGGTPHMDCRVVQIFRKWGFAWGGNFPLSDGMHFEYVGAPRDQVGYPSRYCPTGAPIPPYPPAFVFTRTTEPLSPTILQMLIKRLFAGLFVPSTTATTPDTTNTATTAGAVASNSPISAPAAGPSERDVIFGSDGFDVSAG